uniref:1-acylglycerol-3-phosphate O-acyltransferase n=1 Tax=Thaumasiovibrio occultus TaxID=1891184 RepID=UPI000B34C6B2|nr:1-acylglycerol-3-phosphate O-acyltransferase [Thaumasiovibrio occultus]
MIFVLRLLATAVFAVFMFVFGCAWCLLSPRNPKHVKTIARLFSKMSRVYGVKLEVRFPENPYQDPAVYIANHQSNWDLWTISGAVMPRTVTVGKKSLLWLPLFGQLYWLTGNILIDRNNRSKAVGTIGQVVEKIKQDKVSIWMFPEGTRSRGRGLLPFKTGAFHAATSANVPLIPIVCSSTEKLNLGRWNNGHVIVELMAPVHSDGYGKENVRELAEMCRAQMAEKLAELDAEVAERNKG